MTKRKMVTRGEFSDVRIGKGVVPGSAQDFAGFHRKFRRFFPTLIDLGTVAADRLFDDAGGDRFDL